MLDIEMNIYNIIDEVHSIIYKEDKNIEGFSQKQFYELAQICEMIPYVGLTAYFDFNNLKEYKNGIGEFLKMLFSYGISSCVFYRYVNDVSEKNIELIAENFTYKLLSYEKKVINIDFIYEDMHNREYDIACYYECLGDCCIFYNHKQAKKYYDISLTYFNELSSDENFWIVSGNHTEDQYSYILDYVWSLYYGEAIPYYNIYRFKGAKRIKDKISRLSL